MSTHNIENTEHTWNIKKILEEVAEQQTKSNSPHYPSSIPKKAHHIIDLLGT